LFFEAIQTEPTHYSVKGKPTMPTRKTVPLPGSERKPVRGARVKGPIDGNETIEVRITLRAPDTLQKKADEIAAQPLDQRQYLTRDQLGAALASPQADIEKIEQFARDHNLTVSRVAPEEHAVYLSGAARDMSQAFQTFLECYEQPDGVTYRGRTGAIHIPEELADLIVNVNGLDDRPVARPKLRVRPTLLPHAGPSVTYTPQELAKLYSFPTPANPGKGQTVAIIELGGGFRQSDLDTYFGPNGPKVTAVSVDKAHNKPTGDPNGADGEVMLDIEVVGAIAPSADIAVYFAPNTNKGFIDAINAAVHDKTRKPSVISISWGAPEDGGAFPAAALKAFDQVFQAAALLGVTILAAAGDNGSSDGLSGDHVDFPASSPRVTGCGGTRLLAPDKQKIQSETVWNDGDQGGATGGGVSSVYPVPDYQKGLTVARGNGSSNLSGRGVPDIAANADPVTGYEVLVDGEKFAIGGTSAVAPLLAALVAIFNQSTGKPVGPWNSLLYKAIGTGAFRDITSGNNGTFSAASGWDACTGVGVPIGAALLSVFQGKATMTAS
jgi:kumamolisin